MTLSPLTSHHIMGNTSLDDFLGITEPQVATVLRSDVKSAKELEFDAADVMALFEKKNYKVHMCDQITLNILLRSFSVFI